MAFSYGYFEVVRNLAATLDCGITTVLDAGGADLGVRQAVEDGLIEGLAAHRDHDPQSDRRAQRRVVAFRDLRRVLRRSPGRPEGVVDGPEEMRKRAREVIRAGADVLRVCTAGGVLSPRDTARHAHFRPGRGASGGDRWRGLRAGAWGHPLGLRFGHRARHHGANRRRSQCCSGIEPSSADA
ncbi:hypothetical protein JK364_45930 [Streptomyces sp. 110]|uniref:Uncharacterized protein n=1 Tax=Streptomyces endocoffeicus TaxID=2898945 RepID=A0ABS1Q5L1_9ACTN|nr:hypothetical protein [Streptomyces endocoffeicus]MBL1119619.1 hypothetical protein [Streptomyces endocoffeicus]